MQISIIYKTERLLFSLRYFIVTKGIDMCEEETQLYWEMVRTIQLLGGKSDILDVLNVADSSMSQREAMEEVYRLVKCWNDKVESQIDDIPKNEIYAELKESSC